MIGAGLGPLAAGRWWGPLTAPLWAAGLPEYLWSTVIVGLGVGLAERVLGSRRAGLLALVVQVLGTLLGLGFVALVAMSGGLWGAQLRNTVAVGPTPLAIGCALAVSAGFSALWRRRLRVVLLVVAGHAGPVLRAAGRRAAVDARGCSGWRSGRSGSAGPGGGTAAPSWPRRPGRSPGCWWRCWWPPRRWVR